MNFHGITKHDAKWANKAYSAEARQPGQCEECTVWGQLKVSCIAVNYGIYFLIGYAVA